MRAERPTSPPGPPRQARSRASEERLLATARAILAERDAEEVTVAEIAAGAGLTVGGFYSRFASKEALLVRLEREAFEATRQMAARVARLAEEGAPPIELVRELVAEHVRVYRSNGAVVRALVNRSRSDAALTEELRELARENYALVMRAIERSGVASPGSPSATRAALEFALYAERSVLREAILFDAGWSKERRWSDARIIEETVRMIARYLGLDESAARERRGRTKNRPETAADERRTDR
jgi:AcrR family transcriptional regulator